MAEWQPYKLWQDIIAHWFDEQGNNNYCSVFDKSTSLKKKKEEDIVKESRKLLFASPVRLEVEL